MSFKNPDVFKKVQELVGQTVEVENVKNGDFWEWKSINTASGASSPVTGNPASSSATRVSGSNYETKEERAARQVLIVKQSSLSVASAILSVGAKNPPKKEEVIELAQYFTDWVFSRNDPKPDTTGSIEGMSEDLPW